MNYPIFHVPVPVIFGRGAAKQLGSKLNEMGCKSVMCIIDPGVYNSGILGDTLDSLGSLNVSIFTNVTAEPTDATVDEAAEIAKANAVDCVVGIGGGSSMDTAKAVAIHMEGYSHASEFVLFQPEFIHSKTPIILVPTSAGTGSEVTGVAVISIPAKNGKWSVFTNTDLAIVDPELTVTLPASVTVNTALDALSHAMEAMTSVNRCEHSDVFALAAIERINNYLRVAVMEPGNLEARTQLSLAANFAGFAFANPITHVGHSVADALSVTFHSPHGYNCALALPETMRLVAPAMPEQAASIAKALGISVKGLSPEELGEKIADSIRALMRDVNLKSLKEWGKTLEEITALADEVAENHLSDFSPVKITHEVAEKLLRDVYETY